MKYVALLRGINAGNTRRVDMKRLKGLFESLGYLQVATYINSGNVLFETAVRRDTLRITIETNLKKEFGFDIPALVKTAPEMRRIAEAIPDEWRNDPVQRTDVAYLFPEIDSEKTLKELPVKREYIDARYVRGAIVWNVSRKNYNKSQLNRLVGHRLYQLMTLRNVNTARYLALMT